MGRKWNKIRRICFQWHETHSWFYLDFRWVHLISRVQAFEKTSILDHLNVWGNHKSIRKMLSRRIKTKVHLCKPRWWCHEEIGMEACSAISPLGEVSLWPSLTCLAFSSLLTDSWMVLLYNHTGKITKNCWKARKMLNCFPMIDRHH